MAGIWDALTAVGTLAMSVTTAWLILEGRWQHCERLQPMCVLSPYSGVDDWDRRRALITAVNPSQDHQGYGKLEIHCRLQNVGLGPALNLRIKFRFLDMLGWTSEPWELFPLNSGDAVGSEGFPIVVPFRIRDDFNLTSFQQFEGKPWEIWLTYEDVFGREFETVHSKSPVDTDLSTAEWASTGKAILRTKPWILRQGPTRRRMGLYSLVRQLMVSYASLSSK